MFLPPRLNEKLPVKAIFAKSGQWIDRGEYCIRAVLPSSVVLYAEKMSRAYGIGEQPFIVMLLETTDPETRVREYHIEFVGPAMFYL